MTERKSNFAQQLSRESWQRSLPAQMRGRECRLGFRGIGIHQLWFCSSKDEDPSRKPVFHWIAEQLKNVAMLRGKIPQKTSRRHAARESHWQRG
jgi:hypothetical protein